MKFLNTLLCILIISLWVLPVPVQAGDPIADALFPFLKPPLNNTVIDGDTVSVSTNNGDIKVTPHTLSSSGWVTVKYYPKEMWGDVDICFGFDGKYDIKPTKVESWEPYDHVKTRMVDALITDTFQPDRIVSVQPVKGVVQTDMGDSYINANTATVKFEEIDEATGKTVISEKNIAYDSYDSKTNTFTYKYYGEKAEQYTENYEGWKVSEANVSKSSMVLSGASDWKAIPLPQKVVANKWYEARFWVDIPFDGSGKIEGKYNVAVKPLGMSLSDAKSQNKLILLDPWYSSSWAYRKTLTVYGSPTAAQINYQKKYTVYKGAGTDIPERLAEYTTGDNGGDSIYGATWDGQVFTAEASANVTKVRLKLRKIGAPTSSYACAIRAIAAGVPTGANLCSANITSTDVSATSDWYEFDMGVGVGLTEGTQYAWVFYGTSANNTNYLTPRHHLTSPLYTGGYLVYSINSGSAWNSYAAYDALFQIITTPKIYCGGNCQDDFDDIRFTGWDGITLYDHWIESYVAGTSAEVWVELAHWIPRMTTVNQYSVHYMYYGNSGATGISNGTNTFIKFEDFEWGADGDNINTSGGSVTWTSSVGIPEIDTALFYPGAGSTRSGLWAATEDAYASSITASNNIALQFRYYKTDTADQYFFHGDGTNLAFIRFEADEDISVYNGAGYIDTTLNCLADSWGFLELRDFDWTATTVSVKAAEAIACGQDISYAVVSTTNQWRVLSTVNSASIDNLVVRNYVNPEPLWGTPSAEVSLVTSVSTLAATGSGGTWAVVNGSAILGDVVSGAVVTGFDYGVSVSYGSSQVSTSTASSGVLNFSEYIALLSPATVYHYRAKAYNGVTWFYGADMVFSTTGTAMAHSLCIIGGNSDSSLICSSNITYQTFTTNSTAIPYSVTNVNLMLKRVGVPGLIKVSVRNTAASPTAFLSGTTSANTTTARGFEWGLTSNTTTPVKQTPPTKPYTSNITQQGSYGASTLFGYNAVLGIGNTYYYRSYSMTSYGWFYGAQTTVVGGSNTTVLSCSPIPTGDDLSSGTIDGATLTTSYVMYTITLAKEICLVPSTTYAIVVQCDDADATNYILWQSDDVGDYSGGNAGFSVDSGLTWEGKCLVDQIFMVWGNPCISVINARVFSSYIEDGDWLVTILYKNLYPPYYAEANDVSQYFAWQLYDISSGTVVAQTKCFEWGYKPGAIYMSADSITSLQWGGAYSVRLYGMFTGNPYTEYILQASDWQGSDLTRLDSWVRSTATLMETYYNTTLTTYIAERGVVLNSVGGVIFGTDIPQLSVVRPNLFSIVNTVNVPTLGEYDQAYQDTLVWQVMMGTQLTRVFTSVGNTVGVSGNTIGSWIGFLIYALIALFCFRPGHAIAAMVIPIPVLIIAFGTGLAELALMGILLAVAVVIFVWQFWWKGG